MNVLSTLYSYVLMPPQAVVIMMAPEQGRQWRKQAFFLGTCVFYCYVEDSIDNIPSENKLSPSLIVSPECIQLCLQKIKRVTPLLVSALEFATFGTPPPQTSSGYATGRHIDCLQVFQVYNPKRPYRAFRFSVRAGQKYIYNTVKHVGGKKRIKNHFAKGLI